MVVSYSVIRDIITVIEMMHSKTSCSIFYSYMVVSYSVRRNIITVIEMMHSKTDYVNIF